MAAVARQQKISNKSFRNPASLLSASPDFHYSLLCHHLRIQPETLFPFSLFRPFRPPSREKLLYRVSLSTPLLSLPRITLPYFSLFPRQIFAIYIAFLRAFSTPLFLRMFRFLSLNFCFSLSLSLALGNSRSRAKMCFVRSSCTRPGNFLVHSYVPVVTLYLAPRGLQPKCAAAAGAFETALSSQSRGTGIGRHADGE